VHWYIVGGASDTPPVPYLSSGFVRKKEEKKKKENSWAELWQAQAKLC
jgi:hypothetical protein